MDAPLKRFVKKIPPSGSFPAYKLTLPVQIVLSHLQHLIDTDFELASSPDAINTWQGSIVPRRNKERSEYTLQGWKLWAEAHDIQSGDQVSFELMKPRKMILTVIKRGPGPVMKASPDRVRKATQSMADLEMPSPAKTPKASRHSSPQDGRLAADSTHSPNEIFTLDFDSPVDPDGLDLVWDAFDEGLPPSFDQLNSNAQRDDAMLKDRQYEIKAREDILEARSPLSLPVLSLEPKKDASAYSCHCPLLPTNSSEDLTKMPASTLDARGMVTTPDIYPTPIRRNSTANSLKSGSSSLVEGFSEIGHFGMESNLFSRLSDNPETPRAVSEINEDLRVSWKTFQAKLDRETRTAMRAAMGLETCVIQMSSLSVASPERCNQDVMFRHLRTLKANLWQMLVMSMSDDPQ